MQFSTLALSALLGMASAQQQRTIVVQVGANNNSLTFKPDNIKAAVGDAVQFQFYGGNHTVTQSTFDQPCQPINLNNRNVTGVHSGFVPAAASMSMGMVATYTITINATTPLWLYCAQGRHCPNGMVMVINENTAANASRSLANHKAAAAQAQVLAPGAGGSNGGAPNGGQPGTTDAAPPTQVGPNAGNLLSAPSVLSLLAISFSVLLL
jgi:plastocyanin